MTGDGKPSTPKSSGPLCGALWAGFWNRGARARGLPKQAVWYQAKSIAGESADHDAEESFWAPFFPRCIIPEVPKNNGIAKAQVYSVSTAQPRRKPDSRGMRAFAKQ